MTRHEMLLLLADIDAELRCAPLRDRADFLAVRRVLGLVGKLRVALETPTTERRADR